jgi:carbamoyltransferase
MRGRFHETLEARSEVARAPSGALALSLISRFKARTGCPVLVNTSLNVRGEPPVSTPEDALHCFMGTGIEVLVVGNCLLHKEGQGPTLRRDYEDAFEPNRASASPSDARNL